MSDSTEDLTPIYRHPIHHAGARKASGRLISPKLSDDEIAAANSYINESLRLTIGETEAQKGFLGIASTTCIIDEIHP